MVRQERNGVFSEFFGRFFAAQGCFLLSALAKCALFVYNMCMRCLFVYHLNSGKGRIGQKLPYILKKLSARYETVDVCAAKSAEDFARTVREGAEKYDALIFSGGDGTFNNVLNALGERKALLGYLPSGTVNDIARSLKIPRTVKGALKVILKGEPSELDCMKIGDRYAMYVAAAGAFTSATYHTPQAQKRALGALAYAFEAVKHNLKLEVFPVRVTTGGETVESSAVLAIVMNGKSVAGFPVNREGSMQDGVLETVIIKQVNKPNFLRKIGAYFSLASLFIFGCRVRKRDIVLLRGGETVIETAENVVWDLDGEEGPLGGVRIAALPKHLRLFTPKNKKI